MAKAIKEIIAERIKYHSNKEKYGYFIVNSCIDICASDILEDVKKAGYRKQSETVKEFAEKALALCCKHHYSIATRNNQQGMGMFTEGFEQVLSETAAELAEQYGKEVRDV